MRLPTDDNFKAGMAALAEGRPCAAACCSNEAGTLAVAEMRRRAHEYAACLTSGETIDDDVGGTDEKYVAPFRDYLPEALKAAGFDLDVAFVGGRVVTTLRRATDFADARPQTNRQETAT